MMMGFLLHRRILQYQNQFRDFRWSKKKRNDSHIKKKV
jgi:hypothetical protein